MNMTFWKFFNEGGSIFADEGYTYPESIADYLDSITAVFIKNYGMRKLQKRLDMIAEMMNGGIQEAIWFLIYTLCVEKEYKWKTLIATEQFEYNPIENYNSHEEESIDRTTGAQAISQIFGALTTENRSAEAISQIKDALLHTRTEPQHTDSVTQSKSAENATGWQNDEKTETAYAQQIITDADQAHTDGETRAISSIQSILEHTDRTENGARADGEERTLDRNGNIGTMSTQNMIMQERGVANFSALSEIAHDIFLEIGRAC